MITYNRIAEYWDNVFGKTETGPVKTPDIGHDDLNRALDWLCDNSDSILDFGCGNGIFLFKCCMRGTKTHRGIDISGEAIRVAREIQKLSGIEGFAYSTGGVEKLKTISDNSFDGVILSNIIDNLYPADAIKVLAEAKRILRTGGKLLVKLNPYLTDEKIREWNIRVIENNFLDDGLYLWNQTTGEWTGLLKDYFSIAEYKEIYYPEHDQYNRLFLLRNEKKIVK